MPSPASYAFCSCLILLSSLVGCRNLPEPSPAALAFHDTIPWRHSDIKNLSLTLIDDKRVERLLFSEDGFLPATFGESGGKICGPLFRWKVIRGRLFYTDGTTLGDELYLVSVVNDVLTARRSSGEIVRYKILRP